MAGALSQRWYFPARKSDRPSGGRGGKATRRTTRKARTVSPRGIRLQSKVSMPAFCDVALPVPLNMVFTYRIGERLPIAGGRVLVPFRNERLWGVVTSLHDRAPSMAAKTV